MEKKSVTKAREEELRKEGEQHSLRMEEEQENWEIGKAREWQANLRNLWPGGARRGRSSNNEARLGGKGGCMN